MKDKERTARAAAIISRSVSVRDLWQRWRRTIGFSNVVSIRNFDWAMGV